MRAKPLVAVLAISVAFGAAATGEPLSVSAVSPVVSADFKGTIAIGESRCDPLTVLDDHSRARSEHEGLRAATKGGKRRLRLREPEG